MTPTSLEELERDVARDHALLDLPGARWVPQHASGAETLDVLIVGGGQGGLALAARLRRDHVDNILIVDRKQAGEEGIWMDYARMETLRTPKNIGGPDLGIPSLTYRAWHEAQHGAESFAALRYIPKAAWQAYLGWFRRVLDIPVSNGTRFTGVVPDGDTLRVTLEDAAGSRVVRTRKLVLAGGIETSGTWWMPPEIAALPTPLRAHTADAIDFTALAGKRVVVIGAGASAFDNAATALEHGAQVTMLCRRPDLQRVQPYKVIAYPGFLAHFGSMPDADRWRMMEYLLTVREALTAETWARVTRHDGFTLVTGAAVTSAAADGAQAVIETPVSRFAADFVICGTGFDMDLGARPELRDIAPLIATWGDRRPDGAAPNPRLDGFPYLDAGMAFTERTPGTAPWLRDIHCFNFGATLSFGPSGASISAMRRAVPRLADAITGDLFRADFATHEALVRGYATPEFDLVFARDAASAPQG